MRVLVACEESQEVCKAFREEGFEAFSCDIKDCSGGRPEWHIKGDALETVYNGTWDVLIAHPPCTFMSKAGARWMYPVAGEVCPERLVRCGEARDFFMGLWNAPVKHIAVENPTPLKVARLPAHSQVIQPYQFGHPYSKRTLLGLKNLPSLVPTDVVKNYTPYLPSNTGGKKRGQKHHAGTAHTATEASKTFTGVAKAMAQQWGAYVQSK